MLVYEYMDPYRVFSTQTSPQCRQPKLKQIRNPQILHPKPLNLNPKHLYILKIVSSKCYSNPPRFEITGSLRVLHDHLGFSTSLGFKGGGHRVFKFSALGLRA